MTYDNRVPYGSYKERNDHSSLFSDSHNAELYVRQCSCSETSAVGADRLLHRRDAVRERCTSFCYLERSARCLIANARCGNCCGGTGGVELEMREQRERTLQLHFLT
jgi:hypothetical protein